MNKFLCLLAFTGYISTCPAQIPHYVINGKIDGADGVTLVLQKNIGGKIMYLDTTVVVKGIFKIRGGSVDYPEMVGLTTLDNKKQLYFYLENRVISINGKLDSLNFAKVTGSKTQDELLSLNSALKPMENKYYLFMKEYQDAVKAKDTPKIASLTKQINDFMREAVAIEKDFVRKNPSSFVVPGILAEIMNEYTGSELEIIINSLSPEVAKVQAIVDIRSNLTALKKVDIGQKAPDFSMNDPGGNKVSLSSKTGPKLLLIDFWAGWCAPCRKENPNVVKVYNEFHSKGFDILGVSLDRTEAEWKKAITDDNLTWTHVSDLKYWNNEAARLYSVKSIPANFLLDKDGIIIAKNLRGEELYNIVRQRINEK